MVIRTLGRDIRTFKDFIRTIYCWRIFYTGLSVLLEELEQILELLRILLEQFNNGEFFSPAYRFY